MTKNFIILSSSTSKNISISKLLCLINTLTINSLLDVRPQDIYASKNSLPHEDKLPLNRLRRRHHGALLKIEKRLNNTTADACPESKTTTSHKIKHIIEDCTVHDHIHPNLKIQSLIQ